MPDRIQLRLPPRLFNDQGKIRSVGVELEFAAISVRESAEKVQSLFGGSIHEADRHRFHVKETPFGDFTCELDTWLAHRESGHSPPSGPLSAAWEDFQTQLHGVLGDISAYVLPCEIVCPPIPLTELAQLDRIVDALNEAGVEGTRASPLYAFGAQLNPEIAELSAQWIASVLKAYLLTSEWLRSVMAIDLTRRLTAFTDPFSVDYTAAVVDPNYWPDMDRLIEDYLVANATRNRELDMLPLFTWLNEDQVRRVITDPRVKARPTFHYRLPNANLGELGWNVTLEWNRWSVVERLAEQRQVLNEMGAAYIKNQNRLVPENWALKSSEWLVML